MTTNEDSDLTAIDQGWEDLGPTSVIIRIEAELGRHGADARRSAAGSRRSADHATEAEDQTMGTLEARPRR